MLLLMRSLPQFLFLCLSITTSQRARLPRLALQAPTTPTASPFRAQKKRRTTASPADQTSPAPSTPVPSSGSYAAHPAEGRAAASLTSAFLQPAQHAAAQIRTYAPDSAHSSGGSALSRRMIVIVHGFWAFDRPDSLLFSYSVVFTFDALAPIAVSAVPVAPHVLQLSLPTLAQPAVSHFYVVCTENCSSTVVQRTDFRHFFFQPTTPRDVLSLRIGPSSFALGVGVLQNPLSAATVVAAFRLSVVNLDLSHSELADSDIAQIFTSSASFSHLRFLSLSSNKISSLELLLERLDACGISRILCELDLRGNDVREQRSTEKKKQ
eukprot:TRINITY_DN8714_c0_g1_i1.p1 TRINITY_DN8714_c0_g1~~TRINITY_DN8714_c0_g1_i1.p1  ORF type:complete len:323 (-),score=73.78 TRINITY_DN8714_c0_g1_i1:40-1008(-)